MKRAPDIEAGARFGYLTSIKELPSENGIRKQLVVCDCGTEKVVWSSNLRNGSIKSCGCMHSNGGKAKRIVPNTGDKFGRWTFTGKHESIKSAMFGWFLCACGCEKLISIKSVRSGEKAKFAGKEVVKLAQFSSILDVLQPCEKL